ncbi:HlyD family type I secretion periplasmic adaptor subunit, partial [Vibrio alfacsensis]
IELDQQALEQKSFTVIPGMQAAVDILTGEKTVLSYWLKPILRAKQNSLRER